MSATRSPLRDRDIEGLRRRRSPSTSSPGQHHRCRDLPDDQYTSTLPLVDLTRPSSPSSGCADRRSGEDVGRRGRGRVDRPDAAVWSPRGWRRSRARRTDVAVASLVSPATWARRPVLRARHGDLGVTLTATAPGDQTLDAPLRLRVDDPGKVVSGGPSTWRRLTTTLTIDVATATAVRPSTTRRVRRPATLALGNAALVGCRATAPGRYRRADRVRLRKQRRPRRHGDHEL